MANQDPESGRFVEGNQAALVHGGRRSVDQPDLAHLIAEKMQQVIADLGGQEGLSTITLDYVESYARAVVLSGGSFETMLRRNGPLTNTGKKRSAYTVWLELDERMARRGAALGLERKVKPTSARDVFSEAAR